MKTGTLRDFTKASSKWNQNYSWKSETCMWSSLPSKATILLACLNTFYYIIFSVCICLGSYTYFTLVLFPYPLISPRWLSFFHQKPWYHWELSIIKQELPVVNVWDTSLAESHNLRMNQLHQTIDRPSSGESWMTSSSFEQNIFSWKNAVHVRVNRTSQVMHRRIAKMRWMM